jgi:epoxyqueuosine reductase
MLTMKQRSTIGKVNGLPMTTHDLNEQLKQFGLESRVVPVHHLQDLQNRIEEEHKRGQFAEEFYHERLQFYRFTPPEELPTATSIIVVATPRPQTPVRFSLGGQTITLTLPPTYAGYDQTTHQVGGMISDILTQGGFHLAPALLPLKLLAACSGLVKYGRNNVSYIPGMGSFFQLSAYFSDLPCAEDNWHEPVMMERCKTCQACLKKCPTGAIAADRFLLHAERCLVFHNERPMAHPFPDWIAPEMHNCLIGCMLCQQYCPEDKPFMGWFEDCVDFSQEETSLLLRGCPRNELPEETQRKLEKLGLIDYLDVLPRNLAIFFISEK